MDSQRDSRDPVDVTDAFRAIDEHWRPRVAAELNGQELKLVKFQGEFVWHRHVDADELFLVWRGRMRHEYRDRIVTLDADQFAEVPRGTEHRASADQEVEVLVCESADVRNKGDVVEDAGPHAIRIRSLAGPRRSSLGYLYTVVVVSRPTVSLDTPVRQARLHGPPTSGGGLVIVAGRRSKPVDSAKSPATNPRCGRVAQQDRRIQVLH